MAFLESCHCCQSIAPSWSSPDYAEWHLLSTPRGEVLGVVCVGCLVDEQQLLFELEAAFGLG